MARFTVGQKAAICGLVLAGVSFCKACDIVACCDIKAKKYIPRDYHRVGRAKDWRWRWKGAELERLKAAWWDLSEPVWAHAMDLRTNDRAVRIVAKREGWPGRHQIKQELQMAGRSPRRGSAGDVAVPTPQSGVAARAAFSHEAARAPSRHGAQ